MYGLMNGSTELLDGWIQWTDAMHACNCLVVVILGCSRNAIVC